MMSKSAGLVFGVGILLAVAIFVLSPSSPEATSAGPLSDAAVASGQLPEGHPPVAQGGGGTVAQGPFATVLETMTSAGYTYARVEADGEEIWVAGPVATLNEGDQISLAGAMGMENFNAKSLDRTFESILFLNGFAGPAPAAAEQTGTAVEVMHAAGYTYVRVDQDGTELWLAGLAVDIQEGQTVAWTAGSPMANFDSPTLGRTFAEILFVDGLRIVG